VLHQHLLEKLDSALDLNLARLKCLTLLISSLLRHRTVNLTILATGNLAGAKNESCYRRFQNFFLKCPIPHPAIGRLILAKIPKPSAGWMLSMDRTNWKYGKRHINILTIGVVINKVAIPIVWKVLPQATKRGNSNARQRIKLFTEVLKIMPSEDIHALTMDREFGGEEWLKWLDKKDVGYVVRIKKNILVNGKSAHEHPMISKGKGSQTALNSIMGMELFFAGKVIQSKGRRESHLYVVSNRFSGREALALYRKRWGLFAIVTLSFLFSYGWGCHLRKVRKATVAQKRKSLFRIGLEGILRLLGNPHLQESEQEEFIHWLKLPVLPSIFVV